MFPCCEMGVLVATLLLSGVAISAADAGLYGKALVFPYETDNSYITLTPQKPMELKAFTLCMKLATELKGKREIILFAFRTGDFDELNVWRELDGRYSFYLSGEGVFFDIPQLNTFKTQLCITWESTTGLSAVWLDGKRSVRKVYKSGHTIRPKGTVILGQDPDNYVGGFDAAQSFVGEISDVNMWDYVLPESQIKALYSCSTRHVPRGNIFDWETIEYQIRGKFPCCEMGVLVATLLLSGVAISAADGLYGKALVFPYETDNSYVTLTPQKPMELKAFTLCMKLATELKGKREIILFAYRTGDFDELNVWRELDGRYSFYLSGEGVFFDIPQLNTFKTQLCITWESTTGLSAVWLDGKRSVRKVYKSGHTIRPNGTVILGQDPDNYVGGFDAAQSFVGEISDVNMWDYVLPESQIKALYSCSTRHVPRGNIFDWETIEYQIRGKVFVASAD
ncbi:hypothetical protein SKAU_G00047410 [Synaphobranchus kaupii]|uniref:Pentraxin (PTX) domain-containing protein n=1 Tax=Synaphobranchus kaupii TaxID=118154 RepID=A0A9Q1J8B6_SYNKA|nr:hypothetical protein SKAU_G00047410 [Synaphobranchus kaupii]